MEPDDADDEYDDDDGDDDGDGDDDDGDDGDDDDDDDDVNNRQCAAAAYNCDWSRFGHDDSTCVACFYDCCSVFGYSFMITIVCQFTPLLTISHLLNKLIIL